MSSLPADPYKALGVSKDAQLAEIRSAHRKLVLKCHPDKIQDPKLKEEKQREFQQVQQAYELLSNEAERARYDEKVRLEELRREVRNMASTATSSPRTSKHRESRYNYDVREAEPRPTTFSTSPHNNVYGHTPPSRSWDENLYGRGFDDKPRSARKTASYEKTTSYEYDRERARKEDDRRRREEEKEWARQQERAKERDREERHREREAMREREREKEKEAARKEKDRRKEDKKKAEKDRRKETDDKHRRHKSPYMETFPSDDHDEAIYTTSSSSKPDKKKSSPSKKFDETPAAAPPPPREASQPPPTTDRERKNSANLDNAIRYLSRSGAKPPALGRAQTYHAEFSGVRHVAPIAVPTPPPAAASAFAPPPMADPREATLDGDVKRSSARPRRMSHDTPRSKEKSHKKSSPSKEAIIVDASPSAGPSSGARIVPSFTKSHSIPISGQSESHRMPPLSRSSTETYPRPQPPNLERSSTWMPESDLGRERSRSRHANVYPDDSSEDERDRRHRRSRRTQSPEGIPEDVPVKSTRYTVSSSRKAIPVQEAFYSEDSPRISKKTSYPMPNSSARRAEPRNAYFAEDELEESTPSYFPGGVKYSKQFNPEEIQFSKLPHSLREELFA
ncbi:DnaJ-domain-containing protein [Annulohypoxylon moriforme]|nr:DnaJ-domain-containing protein [Annulohypoxylon moriforme]